MIKLMFFGEEVSILSQSMVIDIAHHVMTEMNITVVLSNSFGSSNITFRVIYGQDNQGN